jgi:hypothetical protein
MNVRGEFRWDKNRLWTITILRGVRARCKGLASTSLWESAGPGAERPFCKYGSAEKLPPKALIDAKLPVFQDYVRRFFRRLGDLVNGETTSLSVYVEGYYGSGKTLLLRKMASLAVQFREVVPVYLYLGRWGPLLYTALGEYIGDLKRYVKGSGLSASVVGLPGDWSGTGKLKALEDCYSSASGDYEVYRFYDSMRCLNSEGLKPFLVLDEMERLVLGDAVRAAATRRAGAGGSALKTDPVDEYVVLLSTYHELLRGHNFSGAVAVAFTREPGSLFHESARSGRIDSMLLERISQGLGKDVLASPDSFPMSAANITYDLNFRLTWNASKLRQFVHECGLDVGECIIRGLAEVLPVPRALLRLSEEAQSAGGSIRDCREVYPLVEDRLHRLLEKLRTEKVPDARGRPRPLVPPHAKWLSDFKRLVEEGLWIFEARDKESKEAARRLEQRCLLERKESNKYIISKIVFAYLLGIERLPDGEEATLENIVSMVKRCVQESRRSSRRSESKGGRGESRGFQWLSAVSGRGRESRRRG